MEDLEISFFSRTYVFRGDGPPFRRTVGPAVALDAA